MGQAQSGLQWYRPTSERKWGKADLAIILGMAAIVPAWSNWLNREQATLELAAPTDASNEQESGDDRQALTPDGVGTATAAAAGTASPPSDTAIVPSDTAIQGSSFYLRPVTQPSTSWLFYKPTSMKHLVQGFGSTFLYLSVLDVLIARKAVDSTSRFFILHALANLAITISCSPNAISSLAGPLHKPYGKMTILPVYLVAGLFIYHLTFFKNVPRDEWVHHILFGGGIGGVGLANPASPLGNALCWFICGLPGGIDYGMLAAVKEGLMSSQSEKVYNTKLNVWLRSPGLSVCAYAMYIAYRHLPPPRPMTAAQTTLVAALAVLNGQYYMQRVVANTAVRVWMHQGSTGTAE